MSSWLVVTLTLVKARSVQLKAVVMSERVLGFDHPNTIQQYVSIDTTSKINIIII